MYQKLERNATRPSGFIDNNVCTNYLEKIKEKLKEQL